jgi:hypothetical protein
MQNLLLWVKKKLDKYNLKAENFTSCWGDGLLFVALCHRLSPNAIDWEFFVCNTSSEADHRRNFTHVFDFAFKVWCEWWWRCS